MSSILPIISLLVIVTIVKGQVPPPPLNCEVWDNKYYCDEISICIWCEGSVLIHLDGSKRSLLGSSKDYCTDYSEDDDRKGCNDEEESHYDSDRRDKPTDHLQKAILVGSIISGITIVLIILAVIVHIIRWVNRRRFNITHYWTQESCYDRDLMI